MSRQRSRRIAWGSAGKVPGQFCSNSQGLTMDGKWGILLASQEAAIKKLLKRHCERGKDVQFFLFCIELLYSGSIIVINQSGSKRKWKGIPRQSSDWNSALVTAEGAGLIPWWGTKILQVAQQGQKLGEDKDKFGDKSSFFSFLPGVQSPNHWTASKVPSFSSKVSLLLNGEQRKGFR